MPADEDVKAARQAAAESLTRMSQTNPQLVTTYLITYVTRTLTVPELADLVEALDRATAPVVELPDAP